MRQDEDEVNSQFTFIKIVPKYSENRSEANHDHLTERQSQNSLLFCIILIILVYRVQNKNHLNVEPTH